VAVIEVGEERGTIDTDVAAALVGAGMLSVLLYPLLGLLIARSPRPKDVSDAEAAPKLEPS
jgi:hypothetical protein